MSSEKVEEIKKAVNETHIDDIGDLLKNYDKSDMDLIQKCAETEIAVFSKNVTTLSYLFAFAAMCTLTPLNIFLALNPDNFIEEHGDNILILSYIISIISIMAISLIFYKLFTLTKSDRFQQIILEIEDYKLTNSEIVEDSIPSKYNKINDEMVSNVKRILEICNEKTAHNSWKLVYWSFTDNFEKLQDISFSDEITDNELEQFVKICDNRLDRAKTFLNDIAIVLGFIIASFSIVLTLAIVGDKLPFLVPDLSINLFVPSLFIVLIGLLAFLAYYRAQVHAWTAFKEKAILTEGRPSIGQETASG